MNWHRAESFNILQNMNEYNFHQLSEFFSTSYKLQTSQ